MPVLHVVGWMLCIVHSTVPAFWLMVHPFAARWRARRRSPYRSLLPIWVAMWVAVGAATWPWRQLLLYDAPWAWMPGASFIATGVFVYSQALRGFSATYLSGRAELDPNRAQPLVTSGIRARVRHPIYLGHLCEMLGWSIGTGMTMLYLLTGFAVVTGALMLRVEEAELERRYGDQYREYKKRAPALLPRL